MGVSASIAAYRVCSLIPELREAGYRVRVVLTRDAHQFITPLTLQSLAGTPVVDDFFSLEGRTKPIHIELGQSADLILVAPATADVIAKLAHGFAEDVLTAAVLASRSPLVIVPAMNDKMLEHPFTRENLKRLEQNGAVIVPPVRGYLVCSDEGLGHIAENEAILKTVRRLLSGK